MADLSGRARERERLRSAAEELRKTKLGRRDDGRTRIGMAFVQKYVIPFDQSCPLPWCPRSFRPFQVWVRRENDHAEAIHQDVYL